MNFFDFLLLFCLLFHIYDAMQLVTQICPSSYNREKLCYNLV